MPVWLRCTLMTPRFTADCERITPGAAKFFRDATLIAGDLIWDMSILPDGNDSTIAACILVERE